jgi:hypothetical protein
LQDQGRESACIGILDDLRNQVDMLPEVKIYQEDEFNQMEMEHEAAMLYTESAYFSENVTHKVPNYNESFAHSIIQSHIP